MTAEIVALAADHAGYELKEELKGELVARGFEVLDLGTNGPDSVDYPDYGDAIARALRAGRAQRGVIVCGSGIGISIAANRHAEVRAALCNEPLSAQLARQHNDAKVLALGSRLVGIEMAKACMDAFLNTEFEGGRHQRRVAKLSGGDSSRD